MSGNAERSELVKYCPNCKQGVYFTLIRFVGENEPMQAFAYVYPNDRYGEAVRSKFSTRAKSFSNPMHITMEKSNDVFCPGCGIRLGERYVSGLIHHMQKSLSEHNERE